MPAPAKTGTIAAALQVINRRMCTMLPPIWPLELSERA
jgi:hypothetical protein